MRKIRIWAKNTSLGWPLIVVVITGFATTSIFIESINYQEVNGRDNLVRLLSGNTLQGDAFWFRYKPDGKVSGYVSRVRDAGTWYASENHYCELWRIWGDGEEQCWQVEQNGKLIRRIRVGSPSLVNEMHLIQNKQ